jgi:hypothetical protein
MGLVEVSSVLWRERELLTLLLFKLEEEQLILASGRTRWLAQATREVTLVLEEIRRLEVVRAGEVDALAVSLGLEPGTSLRMLAEVCEEPWTGILRDHRKAFLETTAEIGMLADTNRALLATGFEAATKALKRLDTLTEPPTELYTATGARRRAGGTRSRLLDSAM